MKLLLLPAIFFLHQWMKPRTAWAELISFCGLAYVFTGSIGAAILAYVWPEIINAFPVAGIAEQLVLKNNFKLVNDIVYGGMWNMLEMIFAGIWWGATGILMLQNHFRFTGWVMLLTGIFCLADAISFIINSEWLHAVALNLYLISAIVWAFAVGVKWVKQFSIAGQKAGMVKPSRRLEATQ